MPAGKPQVRFPRSADRGLIEAWWPINGKRTPEDRFRDQLIAASLKLADPLSDAAHLPRFRDQLIAASLKLPWRAS